MLHRWRRNGLVGAVVLGLLGACTPEDRQEAKDTAKEAVKDVREGAQEAAEDAREVTREAINTAGKIAETAKEKAGEIAELAKEKAGAAAARAKEAGKAAIDKTREAIEKRSRPAEPVSTTGLPGETPPDAPTTGIEGTNGSSIDTAGPPPG